MDVSLTIGCLHKPVLLEEAMHFLNPAPGQRIVDATIGGAGHAEQILKKISPCGTLIGLDRDSESLKIARERLKSVDGSFKLINKNFRFLREVVLDLKIGQLDGILFDLGISSIQMETPGRGFSIKACGPLDMRMDQRQTLTAKHVVNTLRESEIAGLIRDLGEERFYRRIAGAIVSARTRKEIETTAELAGIISGSIPYGKRSRRIHPATRTFQAIRIRVNDELFAIEDVLREMPCLLKIGGRVCVISFHSLEDRIVKNAFRELKAKGSFMPLTKKPVRPMQSEILKNPRSRSARLRAAIKIMA